MARVTTTRRRSGIGRWAVLILVLAGLQHPLASASATTLAGELTATPVDVVMSKEQVKLEGWLPPARARTVRLERKIGDSTWRLVRSLQSSTSGAFTFNDYAPASSGVDVSYRVSAPSASLGGTSYPAVQTPTRTLRVVAQQSSLDAPTRVLRGSSYAVRASFHPARPGRAVVLQRRSGSSWVQAAIGAQAANGTVTFTRPATPLGDVTWRVVARP